MPLEESGVLSGFAVLELHDPPPGWLHEGALLEALGKLLLAAQQHLRLLERVAGLARKAHGESQKLRRELRRYQDDEPGPRLVAHSEAMRRVLEQIDLVADLGTTVLLRGESGTGKELAARRIHQLSRRAGKPLVQLNCGALPLSLLESELLGHEKGAFTGAAERHAGRFERADGGTLLLDEVAELPLSAQVKLLRVLQEGEFERVGGKEPLRVDVRVIAATHRPLEAMVERGE